MRELRLVGPGGGWRVLVPESRRERMRGLRGHPPPGQREGLLLLRCRSVQTVGMTSALGVALLDEGLGVVWFAAVPPDRILLPRRGARHVLECDPGSGLRPGDRFRLEREEADAAELSPRDRAGRPGRQRRRRRRRRPPP